MRKWGIIITTFYTLMVVILIIPGVIIFGFEGGSSWIDTFDLYEHWLPWVWVGILVAGQAVLLLVSVDTSWKRLKPRQHIWVSIVTVALFFGILTFAAVWSLLAGVVGEEVFNDPYEMFVDTPVKILGWWSGLWLLWTIVFFLYTKQLPQWADKAANWLLKGSVLELLIAVSCHVIVRHREDCSAPVFTGFGIATGISVMLLSFGPSILFLFNKRMKQYEK